MIKQFCSMSIALFLFSTLGGVEASPLIIHQEQNDPTTEGWMLEKDGTVIGSLEGGFESTLSGNHNYWKVQDLSSAGIQYYNYSLTDENLSHNWRIEAKLRIVDSPICQNCTDVGGTSIIVADGMNYWSFYLSNNNIGAISNTGKSGQHSLLIATTLDTSSDYHDYVIEFSQNGVGASDDTANFFLDDVLIFSNVGRSGLWTTSEKLIWFGPVGTQSFSDANFEMVCFNASPVALSASVSPNLDIHLPSITYQSLTESLHLWVDLEFYGKDGNNLLWRLKDYGDYTIDCARNEPIAISPNLDIQLTSIDYQLLSGTLNLWANFEYYGLTSAGELLWKLVDYGENQ